MQSSSVKSMFTAALAVIILVLAAMAFCVYRYGAAGDAVSEAHKSRYTSYLLADELRQSSDDLTRLARTYVATGDPKWEQQYFEILDIRNGKKPRPAQYEKIYWDFMAAGIDPAKGTEAAAALSELMKRAGFTDAEFAKLKEAEANSNDLVRTETIAMNMVKGQFDDGVGGFTKKGEPNLEQARTLMQDANYHAFKAKIMKPVDAFLGELDQRTFKAIEQAETIKQWWFLILMGISLVFLVSVLGAMWYVYRQIGGALRHAVEVSDTIASGNLAAQIMLEGPAEIVRVLKALGSMRDSLARVVGSVRQNAESVTAASTQIAHGNDDLSARTEQQATALQETATSMDELSATVRQNAENASQANQLAMSASKVAVKGGEVVGRVVETMKGINESSKKITDIISVIDGIAFQTNILALNAAVEAARAGEQGRGFAVVASEVRGLAQRSAEAAKEIKVLISDSVGRVDEGTQLVDQAGETMTEVVQAIRRVTDIMGEISAASSEQSRGVAQVSEAVTQMDQATQQNAALVEESAAAAGSLKGQAAQLVEVVAGFRLGTEAVVQSHAQRRLPSR